MKALAVLFGLCLLACRGSAEQAFLETDDAESRRVAAVAEAFAAARCDTVESLASGFASRRPLRVAAVSTWLGRCRYRAGRFEAAAQLFAAVAADRSAIDPHTRKSAYFLGRAHQRLQRYADAERSFEDFLRRFPWDTAADDAAYHRARARFKGGDPEGARALFETLLTAPETSELRRAGALYQLGRIDAERAPEPEAVRRAFERFAAVRERYPDTGYVDDAAYRAGRLHYDLEAYPEAESTLGAFLAEFRDSGLRPGAAYYEARSVEEQRRWDEASTLYEPITRGETIYADNAAYRVARVAYRRAEAASPESTTLLFSEADAAFARFLTAWPDSSFRLGATYFQSRARSESGKKAEALAGFETVAASETSAYADNATYSVGKVHYDLAGTRGPEALESSIRAFDALAERFPTSVYADDGAYFRSRALFRLGRNAEAEGAFDALVLAFPTTPYADNALYYGVLLRGARGDCEGARARLGALRSRFPESDYLADAEQAVRACQPVVP